MTERIFVRPAEGKTPRSPLPPYERLPAEGGWRIDAAAWRRLEKAGDVVITKSDPAERPAAKAKA